MDSELRDDAPWTMVDIALPDSGVEDSDSSSIVHVSRASSPLTVQFRNANVVRQVQLHIPWPSSLPWFQFQDRYIDFFGRYASPTRAQRRSTGGLSETTTATSLILGRQHLVALSNSGSLAAAVSEFDKLFPERVEGENTNRVNALIGTDETKAQQQAFQVFVYQLSNNLIEDGDDEYINDEGKYTKIVKVFRSLNLPRSVWKTFLSEELDQPTGRAVLDALFEASLNTRDVDICETLLESGADPDMIIDSWMTGERERPIQHSMDCRVGDVNLARLLIRFGADVDLITDADPETALHKAAKEHSLEAVKLLVEAGASLVIADEYGEEISSYTALSKAVEAGWRISSMPKDELEEFYGDEERPGVAILKYLLSLHDKNRHHDIIQSALIVAASNGRTDMIDLLVAAGANANEASIWGYTPLISASKANYKGRHVPVILELIKLGADPNTPFKPPNASGVCPIHIAAARGSGTLVQALIDHDADIDSPVLLDSIEKEGLLGTDFRNMLSRNLVVPERYYRHLTPLQLALHRNEASNSFYGGGAKDSQAALSLMGAGAALVGGEFADAACFNDHELLRKIHSRGVDVNEVNMAGRSALENCLEFKNTGHVGWLLKVGVKLRGGELLTAVKAGCRETIDILLKHGAEFQAAKGEQSLLETAALSMNWATMVWLMEDHGAPYDPGALCAAVCSGLAESRENETYFKALLRARRSDAIASPLEVTALGHAVFHRHDWLWPQLFEIGIGANCILPFDRGYGDYGFYSIAAGNTADMARDYKKQFWHNLDAIRCSILLPAVLAGNWLAVRSLLKAGYQPDRLSLLAAIKKQPLKCISKLTERMKFEDIQEPARNNLDTPLQAATRFKRPDVIRHFLSLGVNVNAPASRHPTWPINPDWEEPLLPRTALQAAIEHGDSTTIDLLIDAGADINAPPGWDSGATALQLAAGTGQIGIARKLLTLGANVNAKKAPKNGRTALEAASEGGRLDMVQFLLESGAKTDRRSVRLARENGNEAVTKILLDFLS